MMQGSLSKCTIKPAPRDPLLDIVILNFNTGERILECVTSALESDHIQQIVIADNGSSDGTLEKLLALEEEEPTIRVIKNGKNLGFSQGNNRALPYLTAPYTLFLNPDTLIRKEELGRMLNYMENHPDVGMVGPLILNEDGSEQRGCRRNDPIPTLALKTLIGKRNGGINQVGMPLPASPQAVDAISGACMFVRHEALDDVGPLDEGYFLHCEDLDWCKRFWQKGWKVMFLPDVTITHSKGGSSRNRQLRVEWHKHKGMARYYRKFYKDRYPRIMMLAVYGAIWARFLLLAPVWAIRSHLR